MLTKSKYTNLMANPFGFKDIAKKLSPLDNIVHNNRRLRAIKHMVCLSQRRIMLNV